ncbi:MAG: NAD(P)/FAD-dependent oxidoreductase [Bacteroidota bacterium]
MTRQEFLRRTAALGLGAPFLGSLLSSCAEEGIFNPEFTTNFTGRVLIIGAGSAGMHAGFALRQFGIDFQILEASNRFGGRVKKTDDFADFPIDLGAEWIHTDPDVMSRLSGNGSTAGSDIETIRYRPQTYNLWDGEELRKRDIIKHFYAEYKFKSTTWYDYLEQYLAPQVADRILYESPVRSIDYSGDGVVVETLAGETYEADRLILTVPLTQLKQNAIDFTPALPSLKLSALDQVEMPDGLKIFIQFSEQFYPDMTIDGTLSEYLSEEDGDKAIYNAAYGKDTSDHVLALFCVGRHASEYVEQGAEEDVFIHFMEELDTMYDGAATRTYLSHVVQNWTAEPYIGGSYAHYQDYAAQPILGEPVDGKLFFAGEAYSESDQSTVHGAGLSGYEAVEAILSEA